MIKHKYQSPTANDGANEISSTRWNDDHDIDADGLVIPKATSSPSAPAAGNARLFSKSIGGRIMPAFMGPSGLDSTLQPHLARNGWSMWTPAFNATAISAIGNAALTATGTATAAAYAVTSLHTRSRRVDYLVTTAATTAVAGYRLSTATFRMLEGFHHVARVCPATGATVGTRRFFCGMANATAAPTDVQPSSLLNILGVGYDAADTNWQVFTNDGAGTATKIDTGITRPSSDRQSIYSVSIFVPPGGTSATIQLIDEGTGQTFETTATTDIPSTTTTMAPRAYASVGGTSSVVGLSLFSLYIETDN